MLFEIPGHKNTESKYHKAYKIATRPIDTELAKTPIANAAVSTFFSTA